MKCGMHHTPDKPSGNSAIKDTQFLLFFYFSFYSSLTCLVIADINTRRDLAVLTTDEF